MSRIAGLTVGVIGGTGAQGSALGLRWSAAGLKVVIGSRDEERASSVAAEIAETTGNQVLGAGNSRCVQLADVVLLAVPWKAHRQTVEDLSAELAGKILVDCVVPIGFDHRGPYALPVDEGSAAEQALSLAPHASVTAAFHHVSAVLLADLSRSTVDSDVLVLGDDRDVTSTVRELADLIPGMRGIYGGRLRNAAQVEAFTANLVAINKRYKAHAGIRITDV